LQQTREPCAANVNSASDGVEYSSVVALGAAVAVSDESENTAATAIKAKAKKDNTVRIMPPTVEHTPPTAHQILSAGAQR
jgi:nitroimidazol reductase NimA-like FMN-containing flavoprotein (pyridoxamine 5'-phosphate oxidase superfamily)